MQDNLESINLNTELLGSKAEEVYAVLKSRIIGQDAAILSVAKSLNLGYSGLANPNRPRLTILCAGVTGVGKTYLAKSLAFALYGNEDDLVMVNCGSMDESNKHSASASLLGSPAGYVGSERIALLDPRNINRMRSVKPHRWVDSEKEELVEGCIIVFDEIEKAADSLYTTILSLLDTGTVTLGNNKTVDLRSAIIVMTSNCGTKAAQKFEESGSMGFVQDGEKKSSDAIILAEIEHKFSPEFRNRIDKTVIFQPLSRESVNKILSLRIERLEKQIVQSSQPFVLQIHPDVQEALLDLSMESGGARQVNRAVERYLAEPIASCMSSQQIIFGDLVTVTGSKTPFIFRKVVGGGFIVVNGEKTLHVSDGKAQPPKPEPKHMKVNQSDEGVLDWQDTLPQIPYDDDCEPHL